MATAPRGGAAPDGVAEHTDARTQRLRRFELLHGIYGALLKDLGPVKKHVRLDPALLYETVRNYFDELDLTKRHHEIVNADCHKRAAFTMKWIARLRPIQVVSASADLPERAYIVNELFAVRAAFSFLEGVNPEKDTPAMLRALVLICRNRELDSEVLATLMFALEG